MVATEDKQLLITQITKLLVDPNIVRLGVGASIEHSVQKLSPQLTDESKARFTESVSGVLSGSQDSNSAASNLSEGDEASAKMEALQGLEDFFNDERKIHAARAIEGNIELLDLIESALAIRDRNRDAFNKMLRSVEELRKALQSKLGKTSTVSTAQMRARAAEGQPVKNQGEASKNEAGNNNREGAPRPSPKI